MCSCFVATCSFSECFLLLQHVLDGAWWWLLALLVRVSVVLVRVPVFLVRVDSCDPQPHPAAQDLQRSREQACGCVESRGIAG